MGVPPESALFARGAQEMLQLLGARCADCGMINTPPSIHPTCIACGGPKLDPIELARHGVVHTFVVNQTMPAPFVAPLPIAVVDLDDGARVMLQVVGDGTDLDDRHRRRPRAAQVRPRTWSSGVRLQMPGATHRRDPGEG